MNKNVGWHAWYERNFFFQLKLLIKKKDINFTLLSSRDRKRFFNFLTLKWLHLKMMNITEICNIPFNFYCEFRFLEYKVYNFIAARKTRSETLRNLKRRTKGRVKLVRSRIFRDDGTQTCREESAVVIEAQKRKQYLLHTSVIPLQARKLWILKNASLLGEAIFSSFRRNHFFFY